MNDVFSFGMTPGYCAESFLWIWICLCCVSGCWVTFVAFFLTWKVPSLLTFFEAATLIGVTLISLWLALNKKVQISFDVTQLDHRKSKSAEGPSPRSTQPTLNTQPQPPNKQTSMGSEQRIAYTHIQTHTHKQMCKYRHPYTCTHKQREASNLVFTPSQPVHLY